MIALLAALAVSASEPDQPECRYDRQQELARDAVAFDQTEGQGWRPLYDRECFIEAAKLLREWQAKNGADLDLNDPRERSLSHVLVWHEAQMWAFAQRNEVAVPMFERTYREVRGDSGQA